jgi:hypothetical protein
MVSIVEKEPQMDHEKESTAERVSRPGVSVNMLKREAVWQLALAKGVMKPWLVRYLYPADVIDAEARAQEQAA